MPASSIPTSNPPEFGGQVDVCIRGDLNFDLDLPGLERLARKILGDAGFRTGTVSIAIIGDEEMHSLNRRYLDHDYPTDVLSFELESDPDRGCLEGEVIASHEMAARESAGYRWSPREELFLYVVHGLLHLAGMQDGTEEDQAEMRVAEDRYLAGSGIRRHESLQARQASS